KMKNTVEITQKLLLENKEQLEYVLGMAEYLKFCSTESDLIEIQNELTEAKIIKDKSKEKRKPVPISFVRYRINGFSVLVGKNNTQNDFLTFKKAKPWDMWLHTQAVHSAHVLIETEQKDIPDDVLLIAAEITAFYSPARNSGKTAVDYTLRKNLKKPPKSALGYAIYSIYNTLIVKPNEHTEFLV
ncbi:MAG TPA: NFACT RNA binding domain-containing protein, partial [Clostridia bacterium]|nr:NFACT RNA binding domain-containing protein [Clostridia bacterium]